MGCKTTKLCDLRRKVEVGILDDKDGNSDAGESPEDILGKHRSSEYIYCSSLSHVENEFRLRKTYVPNRIISRHLLNLIEEERGASLGSEVSQNSLKSSKGNNVDITEVLSMSNNRPWAEKYEAAVLFADISGFSDLAEALKKELACSANAAEDLSFYIEKCLDQMVRIIVKHGGDVIKFAGDACLAIFDAKYFQNSLPKATLGAALAALELSKQNFSAAGGKLKVHSGIGAGTIVGYHVGGTMNRYEYVVSGQPINDMSHAANESSAGEVVLSKSSYRQLRLSIPKAIRRKSIDSQAIGSDTSWSTSNDGSNGSFAAKRSFEFFTSASSEKKLRKKKSSHHRDNNKTKIHQLHHERFLEPIETLPLSSGNYVVSRVSFPGTTASKYYDESNLNEETCQLLLPSLNAYIPRPALSMITSGSSNRIASFQVCTTMFLQLVGLKFEDGIAFLDTLQKVFTTVQKILNKFGGVVCRFIVDDKGSYILAAFGLPPCRNRDIPKRAVMAAMDINTLLRKSYGVESQIGLTTGKVFCGTVGGSIRNEYTMHGSLVNLAARLMGKALEGILVCDHTRNLTKSFIIYDNARVLNAKGFKNPISVFSPLALHSKINSKNQQTLEVARDAEIPIIGRDLILRFLDTRVRNFANGVQNDLIFLNGGHGTGKTRLCQYFFTSAEAYSINVLLASGQEFQQKQTLEPWRHIILQALEIQNYDMLSTDSRDALAKKLYFLKNKDNLDNFYAIFPELKPCLVEDKQVPHTGGDTSSNKIEEAPLNGLARAKCIGDIVLNVLSKSILCSDSKKNYLGHTIIVFEDAHWMSKVSLEVLKYITSTSKHYMGVVSNLIDDALNESRDNTKDGCGYNDNESVILIEESSLIYLRGLLKKDVLDLCKHVLSARFLATPLLNDIYSKGQGNPLFTLEIVRMMKEQKQLIIGNDSCARMDANLVAKANEGIPDIIVALVLNKLSKIDSDLKRRRVERVMQVASVFGMEFKAGDLLKIEPLRTYVSLRQNKAIKANSMTPPVKARATILHVGDTLENSGDESKPIEERSTEMDTQVLEALDILEQLRVIQKMYKPENALEASRLTYKYYSFCQQYIQAVAYGMLLYDERQTIHTSIACILENESGPTIPSANLTKQLAHHYFKGCVASKALHYLEEAGYRSRIEQEYEVVKLCYIRLLQMCGHHFASNDFSHPVVKRKSRWKLQFEKSERIVKPWMYSNWCLHLADVYVQEDNDDIALQCYYEGLSVLKRKCNSAYTRKSFFTSPLQRTGYDKSLLGNLTNTEIKIASLCYLGIARLDSSLKFKQSQFFYTSAIHLAQRVCSDKNTSSLIASCYVDYAWFLFCSGSKRNISKAMQVFSKCIQLLSQVCDARILIHLHCRFGELLYASGDLATAHNYMKIAMDLCNRNNYYRLQLNMSLLYFYGNQLDSCFQGMQTAISLCSRVDDHQAFFLHVLYLLEKGDLALAADELAHHLSPKLMISKERQRRRSSMNLPVMSPVFNVERNGVASPRWGVAKVVNYKGLNQIIHKYLESQNVFVSFPSICMSLAIFSCLNEWYHNAILACKRCFQHVDKNHWHSGPVTFYLPVATCLSIYFMIKASDQSCVVELQKMEPRVKAAMLLIRHFRHVSVHFSILWEYVHGWLSFRRGSPERAVKIWKNSMQRTKLRSDNLIICRIKHLINLFKAPEKQSLSLSASQILLGCYRKDLRQVPRIETFDQKREASGPNNTKMSPNFQEQK